MLHTLESPSLRISAGNAGAELQSIFSKKTGTEYLWQGDPAWWGGRAPVLFPVIGGLKNGAYIFEGRVYKLPKHGFVRRAYFHSKHEPDKLVFEYVDNPQTRLAFPFEFSLTVAFTLNDNVLHVENRVENQGKGDMCFSVGAHEAYNCPFGENENFEDYFLEFEQAEALESQIVNMKTGLLTGRTYPVPLENGRVLPLRHSLFDNDALVFKSIGSKKVAVKSKNRKAFIEVAYDAPHLGVWQIPGAPYICIEPWCGLPDFDGGDGNFTDKDGIIQLGEGGVFTFTHSIAVNE
jgi:galactose mutarotase-like enzyme